MKQVPVNIAADGDILKISFRDSNKYAGIINCATLGVLLNNWCIRFDATLTAPPHDKQDQALKESKNSKTCLPQECSTRIILYGLASERVAVGVLLSGAGLYLQHPTPNEYDRHVEYINPHYLLRPGSQMPELEFSPKISDPRAQKQVEPLDEVNKSRFMRIFDLANETVSPATVETSSRLRSTLQEYESSFMISKYLASVLTKVAINSGLWP